MSAARPKPKNVFRRMERWAVGLAMAVVAFVLERVVMRSVREGGKEAPPEPTTLTSKGGKVDLPD